MSIENSASINKILISFIKKKWLAFLSLLLALAFSGFAEAYPIKYMQRIIDNLLAGSKYEILLGLVGIWYIFKVLMALAGFISGWLSGFIGATLGKEFRDILFKRLKASEYIHLDEASSSETIVRTLEDVYDLGNLITQPIVMVGRNLFIFLWSFLFLIQLDWVLLLCSLPLGLLMLVVGNRVSKLNYKVWKDQRNYYTKIVNCLLETVTACREIILFNMWSKQEKDFEKYNRGVAKSQGSTAFLTSGLNNFTEALWPVATVLCLVIGGYRVLDGKLTTGGMVAFMWYIQWVIHPISQIANYHVQLQKSVVAMERIQEMLEWFPPITRKRGTKKVESIIELKDITFSYDQKKNILTDVDFTISKGEIVALVGETGCGKSTLIKIILGLLKPTSGQIIVDGKAIESYELCGSSSLGAVFQDAYLFNISIKDNVAINTDKNNEELEELINEAFAKAHVLPFLRTLPYGEDTIVGEQSTRLSSGQRQRVALARALVRKPNILVLDEATSTVDTATEEKIYQSLFEKRDFGCIIISHRLASVIGADKICMMKNGRIIAAGKHQELIKTCNEYFALYSAQILKEETENGTEQVKIG